MSTSEQHCRSRSTRAPAKQGLGRQQQRNKVAQTPTQVHGQAARVKRHIGPFALPKLERDAQHSGERETSANDKHQSHAASGKSQSRPNRGQRGGADRHGTDQRDAKVRSDDFQHKARRRNDLVQTQRQTGEQIARTQRQEDRKGSADNDATAIAPYAGDESYSAIWRENRAAGIRQ